MATSDKRLRKMLEQRVLVLDGATGTAIQACHLGPADFGGAEYEGCNEHLVLTRPDVVSAIYESYLAAGCDIVETNTFGATPLVLAEYGLAERAFAINKTAAELARAAADKYASPSQPRFVAGSMGPTTKAISVTGGITFAQLVDTFSEQARGLLAGGVDYLLLETCQDTRNVKAALLGIQRLFDAGGRQVPVAVSGTIEPMGTMLAGQGVDALFASVSHVDLLYLGLNCATGPEFMTDHVRTLAALSRFPVACVPNAGLPDENGHYLETPEMMSAVLERFGKHAWLNVIGGCCGTTPAHIAQFAALAPRLPVHRPSRRRAAIVSGIDFLELTDEIRPVIVGERSNVIGSRKFKKLICEEQFEEAAEVARAQAKSGAQIIDVCLANPDRPELPDMTRFLEHLVRKVKAPLMIDSTDPVVIEAALTYCQGKAVINSINLEDGLERFERVVPLARRYGAALVVGTIDEDPVQGMAITRERKVAIAERAYRLLTQDFGIPGEDIWWDPLTFPCATGDQNYRGSAVETIEGIRLIKQRFPETRTILGVSNVSFGLPPAGREVLNAVFLYHCVQAGLDLAIVNAEKLERYASLSEEERRLAEDLLFSRGPDPAAAFADHFRDRAPRAPAAERAKLPLDQRLANYIVEGSKDGLVADLELKRQEAAPLDIINGPLMAGMDQVGRLFNENKLIVAEVLQSAEAMKAAVAYLEPFLDKSQSSVRGRIVLATVKGDVHDIGKNLVHVILANNGFEVVNLGIKVPPEQLIQAVREHRPDIVGLSGLLVKSAQMMLTTVEDFSRAGIATPVLVGGAALSEKFVMTRIAPAYRGMAVYAQDAMQGLELAKALVNPAAREALKASLAQRCAQRYGAPEEAAPAPAAGQVRSAEMPPVPQPPAPPDFDRHVLRSVPIDQIWGWINPRMLYGRHLGLKGHSVRLLEEALYDHRALARLEQEDASAYRLWQAVEEVKQRYRGTPIMQAAAVYRFYRCEGQGNRLQLYEGAAAAPAATFEFPRQPRPEGLCLADLANPPGAAADNCGLFVVTVGNGLRQEADELNRRGEYLRGHILQALALESAEAFAEWLHAEIRRLWGLPDPEETTMMNLFQAKYRGRRYSFGYPACPRLEDQTLLWQLLRPEEIGCQLTEQFMMDPESSVSALAFHHPQAQYFSVQ